MALPTTASLRLHRYHDYALHLRSSGHHGLYCLSQGICLDMVGTGSVSGRTWTAVVTILVEDDAHNAVSGAVVQGNGGSCTTDNSGACQVTISGLGKKSYTFAVEGVSHGQFTYDTSANHDPDGDSNGTSIKIQKP